MNNKIVTGIAVVAALAIASLFFIPKFLGVNTVVPTETSNQGASVIDSTSGGTTLPSGLIIKDEVIGTGEEVVNGTQVTVNYVGALQSGVVFDASSAHGQPLVFIVGEGRVIPGWEQGLTGMKVGGKRLLTIPPSLAYGAQPVQGKDANGNIVDIIPANSTLIFEVELLKAQKVAPTTIAPQAN